MSVALIELSPETPAPPAPSAPPPAYFFRRIGSALVVALVLALGGAAPAASTLWSRIGSVPLPAGGDFQVAGDRIFTVDLDADPRVLTAWQAGAARRLWSVTVAETADPLLVGAATTELLFVRQGRSVSVRDARTGAVRWSWNGPIRRLTAAAGVVQRENFRPGTEYDPESGDPGRLYGTTTDVLHTEPARSTDLRGVDLATGRELWTHTLPGSVYTAVTEAPEPGLIVLTSQKLMLLSPAGAVLREQAVPQDGGQAPTSGEVVDGMVLVSYGAFGSGGRTVAYAADTLTRLWQRDQPDPAGNFSGCYGLACEVSSDEIGVLDPRTGAVRWRVTDRDVRELGPGSVLEVGAPNKPLRTAEKDTGRTQADLAGWAGLYAIEGRAAYLLTRPEPDRRTAFGLLLPGGRGVQPLGLLAGSTANCQSVPGVIACQVLDRLEVWEYSG